MHDSVVEGLFGFGASCASFPGRVEASFEVGAAGDERKTEEPGKTFLRGVLRGLDCRARRSSHNPSTKHHAAASFS